MTAVSFMNKKLLRQIKDKILEDPKAFNMRWWHLSRSGERLVGWWAKKPCGTAHCIAGWAQVLTGENGYPSIVAQEQLRLTEEQATRLFHESNWPEEFCYSHYWSKLQRAETAAARIEHFIKTEGQE